MLWGKEPTAEYEECRVLMILREKSEGGSARDFSSGKLALGGGVRYTWSLRACAAISRVRIHTDVPYRIRSALVTKLSCCMSGVQCVVQ